MLGCYGSECVFRWYKRELLALTCVERSLGSTMEVLLKA